MTNDSTYEAPMMSEIGTVHELTLAANKVGGAADIYTGQVPVVGSITGSP